MSLSIKINRNYVAMVGIAGIAVLLSIIIFAKACNDGAQATASKDSTFTTVPTGYAYTDVAKSSVEGDAQYVSGDSSDEEQTIGGKDAMDTILENQQRNIARTTREITGPVTPETSSQTDQAENPYAAEDRLLAAYTQKIQGTTAANTIPPATGYQPPVPALAAQHPVKPGKTFNNVGGAPAGNSARSQWDAIILKETTVSTGYSIGVLLLQAVELDGVYIPSNTTLSGVVGLGGNRMNISIAGTQVDGRQITLGLVAFDTDGLEGLRLANNPDGAAAGNAVAAESSSELSSLGNNGVLGSAIRVLTAVKDRHNGLQWVKVPAGHKMILKLTTHA